MKEKDEKEIDPPAWLVNLLIRERVWRWKVCERLGRWAKGQAPGNIRIYVLTFVLLGGLICTWGLINAVHRQESRRFFLDSVSLNLMQAYERHRWWDSLSDDPKFQRDWAIFWRLTDSINADSNLRRSIDSLLHVRPGLADSLRQVKAMHPRNGH